MTATGMTIEKWFPPNYKQRHSNNIPNLATLRFNPPHAHYCHKIQTEFTHESPETKLKKEHTFQESHTYNWTICQIYEFERSGSSCNPQFVSCDDINSSSHLNDTFPSVGNVITAEMIRKDKHGRMWIYTTCFQALFQHLRGPERNKCHHKPCRLVSLLDNINKTDNGKVVRA
jgi:hypothetical protein